MMKKMTIPEPPIGSSVAPIKTVLVKSGFALGPEGSIFKAARTLRIEIKEMKLHNPTQIREFPQNPTYVYRGEIQIEKARYRLVDVNIRLQDSEVVMEAGLADIRDDDKGFPRYSNRNDLIGEIETRESGGIAKGRLVINQGIFSGRYTVHLDAPIEY